MLIQAGGQDGLQQRPRVTVSQGRDAKLGQSRERVTQLASREHERDLLRQQAAGHERERARRCTIEPLPVIHDAQQRPLLGRLREQTEGRQSDEKRVRSLSRGQPEGHAERIALGLGQALRAFEDRRAQLLERRKWKLHLALDPDGPQDLQLPLLLDHPIEQCCLADARLAMHDQDATVAGARTVGQADERLALALAADQLRSRWPR